MDGILALFQSIARTDRVQLPGLLNQLKDHKTFQHKTNAELNPIAVQITDLLNDLTTKHDGLLLLAAFLDECPLDVLEQKGTLWITLCTKVCAQRKPIESIPLAYNILGLLLKRSVHVPDLGKSISGNLLAKIVETVSQTHTPPAAHYAALKFLELAMLTYAGPCGSTKVTIEKFVMSFVDSTDDELVKQAGKCLQLLQQVRGGGAHGESHKTAWAQLQTQLLGSLHEYLSGLFSNTLETGDENTITERVNVPDIVLSDEPLPRALQLERRFVNLCKYLVAVLVEPFPVVKSIQPAKILNLIARGLAVNCSLLSKNLIIDNVAVGALIPRIHVALLTLLNSLISVLKSHMLVYGHNVLQLMNQSLKWTSSGKSSGFQRLFCTIRRATYFSLDLWCQTMYAGSGTELIADELIQQILQDITPYHSEVTLNALSGSKKHVSRQMRQKLLKAQNESTNLAQTHSTAAQNTKIMLTDKGNEQLCSSALRCLYNIIMSNGCFIKPTIHKICQEHIVLLAYTVVQSASLQNNLYNSVSCRANLFDALYALTVSPHHLCPPPLAHATKIFSIGQALDVDANVRKLCNVHLIALSHILHPQKDSLNFPLDSAEVREAFKEWHRNEDAAEDSDNEEEILVEEMETDDINVANEPCENSVMYVETVIDEHEKSAAISHNEDATVVSDPDNGQISVQAEPIESTENTTSESVLPVETTDSTCANSDSDNQNDNANGIDENCMELPANESLLLDEDTTDSITCNDVIEIGSNDNASGCAVNSQQVKKRQMRLKLRKVRLSDTIDISDEDYDAENDLEKRKIPSRKSSERNVCADSIVVESDSESDEVIDLSAEKLLDKFVDDLKDIM